MGWSCNEIVGSVGGGGAASPGGGVLEAGVGPVRALFGFSQFKKAMTLACSARKQISIS